MFMYSICARNKGKIPVQISGCVNRVVFGQTGIEPKRGMLTEKKLDVIGAGTNISSKISWIRVPGFNVSCFKCRLVSKGNLELECDILRRFMECMRKNREHFYHPL